MKGIRHLRPMNYEEIDLAEQKMHANYIRDHIEDEMNTVCRDFLEKYFSKLWD